LLEVVEEEPLAVQEVRGVRGVGVLPTVVNIVVVTHSCCLGCRHIVHIVVVHCCHSNRTGCLAWVARLGTCCCWLVAKYFGVFHFSGQAPYFLLGSPGRKGQPAAGDSAVSYILVEEVDKAADNLAWMLDFDNLEVTASDKTEAIERNYYNRFDCLEVDTLEVDWFDFSTQLTPDHLEKHWDNYHVVNDHPRVSYSDIASHFDLTANCLLVVDILGSHPQCFDFVLHYHSESPGVYPMTVAWHSTAVDY